MEPPRGEAALGEAALGSFPGQQEHGAPEQSSPKHPAATQDRPSPQRAMAASSPNCTNNKVGERGKVSWVDFDAYYGQVILPSLVAWGK